MDELLTEVERTVPRKRAHPLSKLPEEDLDFVEQFVLASDRSRRWRCCTT